MAHTTCLPASYIICALLTHIARALSCHKYCRQRNLSLLSAETQSIGHKFNNFDPICSTSLHSAFVLHPNILKLFHYLRSYSTVVTENIGTKKFEMGIHFSCNFGSMIIGESIWTCECSFRRASAILGRCEFMCFYTSMLQNTVCDLKKENVFYHIAVDFLCFDPAKSSRFKADNS